MASLVDTGVASPADLAGGVIVGVASLADAGVVPLANAGVAFLTDAGVTSLHNIAGSVAGGVTDLAVLVCVGTEEMTLLQECVVRDRSVFDGLVYCDSEMDCSDCVLPNAWCQEMPEIWFVNMLTIWAATLTVWTELYRRAVTITRLCLVRRCCIYTGIDCTEITDRSPSTGPRKRPR